jgi:hypothetical protein
MIQITPQHQLFLYLHPLDFRKGMDGLIGICRQKIKMDPFSGTVFIFRNRFSQGKLKFWPTQENQPICATTLMVMLNQGQPGEMQSSWKAVASSAL